MEIIDLYRELKTLGISPNEYTLLSHLHHNIEENFNFNEHLSKRILIKSGFLDKMGQFTDKGKSLFGESVEQKNNPIERYREIFPKGILPNGRPARSAHQELDRKFTWFFNTYKYNWDTVLKATKEYVEYYEKQDYKYMQTSSNFISKQDTDRIKSSALAEWCDKIKNGDEINVEFGINV